MYLHLYFGQEEGKGGFQRCRNEIRLIERIDKAWAKRN